MAGCKKKGNPLKGRSLNGTNRNRQERIILISHVSDYTRFTRNKDLPKYAKMTVLN